jgi:hypothetical protein
VLAYSSEPLLAVDIARELETPGNLRDRTQMVRAELRSCGAFTEVSRGRWVLGKPSGYTPEALPLVEMLDYNERLHKNTRRPWTYTSGQSPTAAASGGVTNENSVSSPTTTG